MHIWPSKRVLKTGKLWHTAPPKNASPEDYKVWKSIERDYKHTMLGIVKKEAPVDNKKK